MTDGAPVPERAATRLLLGQRLHSLRFDVAGLDFEHPILFDTIQHFCSTTRSAMHRLEGGAVRDGLTLRAPRGNTTLFIVLYNADAHASRRRFTLAHEIGHICLGHRSDGRREEREADAFAAQLLMPRILVDQLVGIWRDEADAGMVCEVFGVSRQAAEIRLRSLREPVRYGGDDDRLLLRFAALLPGPREPAVTLP